MAGGRAFTLLTMSGLIRRRTMTDSLPFHDSHWQQLVEELRRELERTKSHLEFTQFIAFALFFALFGVLLFR
jgi:hypothetical protein